MLDFFERQARAHKNTLKLLLLAPITVLGVAAAVHVVVWLVLGAWDLFFDTSMGYALVGEASFGGTAVATLIIVALFGLYRVYTLRAGGPAVAKMVGGRRVQRRTDDAEERRLLAVVEEMAIASGLPVPDVYVLDDDGINALAAGLTPHDACVAVSRGALSRLSRDELQGVVAHEMSHILHGDMRLNVRLMGLVYGILALQVIAETYFMGLGKAGEGSSKSSCDNVDCGDGGIEGALGLVFILVLSVVASALLMAIGAVGAFFARVVKAAVSREREFLADAAAVEFTRNPAGLAGALKKAGAAPTERGRFTEEASHLFFSSILGGRSSWLATHPPLEERIRRLEGRARELGLPLSAPAVAPGDDLPAGAAGLAPGRVVDAARRLGPEQVDRGRRLLDGLPEDLREMTRSDRGARALVAALLLSRDPAARARQLAVVGAPGLEVDALRERIEALPEDAPMALLDLLVPSLRPSDEIDDALGRIVEAQGAPPTLWQRLVRTLARRHLRPKARALPLPVKRRVPRGRAIGRVLAATVEAGHGRSLDAGSVYRIAHGRLPSWLAVPGDLDEAARPDLAASLDRIGDMRPEAKALTLEACSVAAAHDGVLTRGEVEMLRLLGAVMGCPVPAVLR